MKSIGQRKSVVNISQAERIVSAIGGGILASAGILRRTPGGVALALVGGDLLRRGITGHSYAYSALGLRTAPKGQGAETTSIPYQSGIRIDRAITIAHPRDEVYRFWHDFSNLPRFMKNLESVTDLGGGRSHWVVKGPGGRTFEWDAVIHNEIDEELIAWRSLPGSEVDSAGSVWFKDAPHGRGTEVKVELQYNPPAGSVGVLFASLLGKQPARQVEEDLARLKEVFENGTLTRPHRTKDRVQEASEESFPASDAPAFNY
ncbi:MAG TPA: SRPBCC family protein [Bryobacteraceae bacterium]|nr:SRPBCC family protein [Bryobacteraceae bacterium]